MDVLTPFEIGYIIGVIVGEGTFTSSQGSPHMSINLAANDLVTLQYIQQRLGGLIHGPYESERHYHQPHCIYRLRGAALAEASLMFLEYMPPSHKREQFLDWYAFYKPRFELKRFGKGWRKGMKNGHTV
jgi:hypothetical protein